MDQVLRQVHSLRSLVAPYHPPYHPDSNEQRAPLGNSFGRKHPVPPVWIAWGPGRLKRGSSSGRWPHGLQLCWVRSKAAISCWCSQNIQLDNSATVRACSLHLILRPKNHVGSHVPCISMTYHDCLRQEDITAHHTHHMSHLLYTQEAPKGNGLCPQELPEKTRYASYRFFSSRSPTNGF